MSGFRNPFAVVHDTRCDPLSDIFGVKQSDGVYKDCDDTGSSGSSLQTKPRVHGDLADVDDCNRDPLSPRRKREIVEGKADSYSALVETQEGLLQAHVPCGARHDAVVERPLKRSKSTSDSSKDMEMDPETVQHIDAVPEDTVHRTIDIADIALESLPQRADWPVTRIVITSDSRHEFLGDNDSPDVAARNCRIGLTEFIVSGLKLPGASGSQTPESSSRLYHALCCWQYPSSENAVINLDTSSKASQDLRTKARRLEAILARARSGAKERLTFEEQAEYRSFLSCERQWQATALGHSSDNGARSNVFSDAWDSVVNCGHDGAQLWCLAGTFMLELRNSWGTSNYASLECVLRKVTPGFVRMLASKDVQFVSVESNHADLPHFKLASCSNIAVREAESLAALKRVMMEWVEPNTLLRSRGQPLLIASLPFPNAIISQAKVTRQEVATSTESRSHRCTIDGFILSDGVESIQMLAAGAGILPKGISRSSIWKLYK